MVPEPSFSVPFHSAVELRIAILSALSPVGDFVDLSDYIRPNSQITGCPRFLNREGWRHAGYPLDLLCPQILWPSSLGIVDPGAGPEPGRSGKSGDPLLEGRDFSAAGPNRQAKRDGLIDNWHRPPRSPGTRRARRTGLRPFYPAPPAIPAPVSNK